MDHARCWKSNATHPSWRLDNTTTTRLIQRAGQTIAEATAVAIITIAATVATAEVIEAAQQER